MNETRREATSGMDRSHLQRMHEQQKAERDDADRKHLALLQILESNYQTAFRRLGSDYQTALDRLGTVHQAALDRLTSQHEERTFQIMTRQKAQSRGFDTALPDAVSLGAVRPHTTSEDETGTMRKRDRPKSGSPTSSHGHARKRERTSVGEGGKEPERSPRSVDELVLGPHTRQRTAPEGALSDLDYAFCDHVLAKLNDEAGPVTNESVSKLVEREDDDSKSLDQPGHPLDLGVIRARLMNSHYGSIEEFKKDVNLIIADGLRRESSSHASNKSTSNTSKKSSSSTKSRYIKRPSATHANEGDPVLSEQLARRPEQ